MKNYDKDSFKVIFEHNICPILLKDMDLSIFDHYVMLDYTCDISDLNGHYEGIEFFPPKWYEELIKMSIYDDCVLVIQDVNYLPIPKQKKFNEILKYRKVSTFELPSHCRIVLLCHDLEKFPLSSEVSSLVAHV